MRSRLLEANVSGSASFRLRIARVSAEELKTRLDGSDTPLVVDLRTALDVKAMPYAIPGAVRIAAGGPRAATSRPAS